MLLNTFYCATISSLTVAGMFTVELCSSPTEEAAKTLYGYSVLKWEVCPARLLAGEFARFPKYVEHCEEI